MNAQSVALEAATIRQQCKVLRMPTIAAQCAPLAEQAVRERRTHLGYLEALLQAELEEREQRLIERRIREARLPRMKTLEEFDFGRNAQVSAQQIHQLAKGDYLAKAEPIIFIGDSGTGKRTYSPAWRSRPAGRSDAYVSPAPPGSSTKWSRPSISCNWAARCRAGRGTI